VKAGVTLNPATPLSLLQEILGDVDLVLIMSVNPGFGGQAFIPSVFKKITEARRMLDQIKSHALLEVDGGVKVENAREIVASGATVLVAGSAIFSQHDYTATIAAMRAAGETASSPASRAAVHR
jgi:ribulose-phosphate 3-epimerase